MKIDDCIGRLVIVTDLRFSIRGILQKKISTEPIYRVDPAYSGDVVFFKDDIRDIDKAKDSNIRILLK